MLKNIDISLSIEKREEEGTIIVVFRILDSEYKSMQLERELKSIKSKNKFKTEFLSNIANDIKKPINTIFETNNKLINEFFWFIVKCPLEKIYINIILRYACMWYKKICILLINSFF